MIEFLLRDGRIIEPTGYDEIVIAAVAVGLTTAKVRACMCCYVRFESGPVRYRVDGVDPTDSVGLPAFDGQEQLIWGPAIGNFRAIRSTATDGMMRVVYGRPIVGWGEYAL